MNDAPVPTRRQSRAGSEPPRRTGGRRDRRRWRLRSADRRDGRRAGAAVVVADIDGVAAEQVAGIERSGVPVGVKVDVCDRSQVEALVARTVVFRALDVMVNNASHALALRRPCRSRGMGPLHRHQPQGVLHGSLLRPDGRSGKRPRGQHLVVYASAERPDRAVQRPRRRSRSCRTRCGGRADQGDRRAADRRAAPVWAQV